MPVVTPVALPRGTASLRPQVETCIIPKTAAIDEEESTLAWSLVVRVVGPRPRVPLSSVTTAICSRFSALDGSFSTHRYWPDDFLVVFRSREGRDAVMAAEVMGGRGFTLHFAPWNKFRQAVGRSPPFRVHLELEGIPPHAWSVETAVAVIDSSCKVERLGSETASRADMGRFRVFAWTVDPCLVPREKVLEIAEPLSLVEEEDDDLMIPLERLIPSEVNLLDYRVLIHLLQTEEVGALTDRSSSAGWSSNDGDDGHNGNPSRTIDSGGMPVAPGATPSPAHGGVWITTISAIAMVGMRTMVVVWTGRAWRLLTGPASRSRRRSSSWRDSSAGLCRSPRSLGPRLIRCLRRTGTPCGLKPHLSLRQAARRGVMRPLRVAVRLRWIGRTDMRHLTTRRLQRATSQ